ncbi:Bug family tripartite tricarboxylate transporter substrate binding protein [Georgenia sp. AZ-5]|uniref:Bug family tripartite tricarboxylate transporter substrate binding protein n=1 Tax=Georgenia sp. AZ-5 TaxID=3367526 RepID=UPI00375502D4
MMSTPTSRKRAVGAALAGLTALVLAACGGVQGGAGAEEEAPDYPTEPVELTVPFSPGGATDLIGRAFAKAIQEPLGQPMPVVNREGANGAVGGKEVLGREADGYSLVFLPQSLMAITPLAVDDADPIELEDMDIVTGVTQEDYVLVVNAETSPYQTIDDLLATPGLSYGNTGVGSGSHLSAAALTTLSGVEHNTVPFEGGGPAVTALLGSQVDAVSTQLLEAMPHIESGKFRPLVVFAAERSEYLPDVPTATEAGFDVVVEQRRFVAAPAGLPDNVRSHLEESFATAFEDPAYGEFLEENYASRWEVGPEEAEEALAEAKEQYATLVDELGIDLKSGS